MNHITGYTELLQEQVEAEELGYLRPGLVELREHGRKLLRTLNIHLDASRPAVTPDDIALLRKELPPLLGAAGTVAELLRDQAAAHGQAEVVSDLERVLFATGRLDELVNDDGLLVSEALGYPDVRADESPIASSDRSHEGHTVGPGTRILLVEDNELSRDMLSRRLEREGHVVSTASGGRQALEILRHHPFDLILLDLMMPDVNGFEVLEHVKSDPGLRDTPVIMLSALDEIDSVARCIEAGAEDYLPKPFDAVLLRARISASLEKKRLRDQEILSRRLIEAERSRSNELLNVILPLGLALSAETEFVSLAGRILESVKSICRAEGGTLFLREGEGLLRVALMYNDSLGVSLDGTVAGTDLPFAPIELFDPATGEAFTRDVAALAVHEGRSVNISDLYSAEGQHFEATRAFNEVHGCNFRSVLCVPLKNHLDEVIGVVQLLNARDQESGATVPFSPYLQQIVESLSSQCAVVLNNQLLRQRETALAKFERDVQIGRQIQADFLPETLVQPAGWEVAAYFAPAREVSGDFYDVFKLPGGHIGLVLADVCDKGVGASLFMALTRSLLRAFSERAQIAAQMFAGGGDGGDVHSVRHQLTALLADLNALNTVVLANDYLATNHARTNMFVTLFFGIVDPDTGVLTYVNGGHESPILLDSEGVKERLRPTGPAVGMMAGMDFGIKQTTMQPGDMLVAYTDGVPDARDVAGARFSEERLLEVLCDRPPSVQASLEHIASAVRSHIGEADQFDDITQLGVRRLQQTSTP
jgi:phosphoserine phosphatase RsbU/P